MSRHTRWDTLDERIGHAPTWNVGDFVAWTMSHGSDYRFHAVVIKTYKRKVKIRFLKPMWYKTEFEKSENVVEPWLLVPFSPVQPEVRFDGVCCAPGCVNFADARHLASREAPPPQSGMLFCKEHK